MAVTAEQILKSYGFYLRAKIQEQEFRGWGASITDTFLKRIADHEALEAEWVKQEVERRRREGSG